MLIKLNTVKLFCVMLKQFMEKKIPCLMVLKLKNSTRVFFFPEKIPLILRKKYFAHDFKEDFHEVLFIRNNW